MTRFRRHTIHSKRSRRGNGLYIIALLLLGGVMVWMLTLDLENTFAIKWMTSAASQQGDRNVETRVFPAGQFGVVAGDSIPVWIACQSAALPVDDRVIFSSTGLDGSYSLELSDDQLPLWNDYVHHVQYWAQDCDSLFVIYGPIPENRSVYGINLCINEFSRGLAVLVPDSLTSLPFFQYTMSIDHMERKVSVDFFGDLLDPESEAFIEGNFERFQWMYPDSFYRNRINENQNRTNAD